MSAAFQTWTTYFVTARDTIVRHLPLTLLWGVEPPLVLQRNGIPCTRITFDEYRRIVAYAAFGVEADLRVTVELIQKVHEEPYAE